jgi:glucosamine-phosphate N-acetyltransferase
MNIEEANEIYKSLPNNIKIFMVRDEDKTIACATLIIEQKFINNGGKVSHIEDVIVNPNYRSKGIGKSLIEHLVKESQKEGCYKCILNCNKEVSGFYEKLGFQNSCLQLRKDL